MSYQSGSATDLDDLMSKLDTFLTGTPGWTQVLYDGTNRRAVYSRAGSPQPVSRLFQIQWDNTNGYWGNSLIGAYTGNVTWNNQTEPEFSNGVITNCRYTNMMTGPFPSYHFFEDDFYIHVVVEISSGIYRHWGFGQGQLLGTLTGGAYCHALYWEQNTLYIDNPQAYQHAGSYDGAGNQSNQTRGHSIHCLGAPSLYDPNTKYFRHYSSYTATDGDGDNIGGLMATGWRDGAYVQFMSAQSSDLNGFKPLLPIALYGENVQPAPDAHFLMGYIPDIRTVNMYGLQPGEELSVGSDTWVVFPVSRKGNNGLTFNQEQSWNFGFAYKKVTT